MKASDYEKAIEKGCQRGWAAWQVKMRAREIAAARQASEPAGGEVVQELRELEEWRNRAAADRNWSRGSEVDLLGQIIDRLAAELAAWKNIAISVNVSEFETSWNTKEKIVAQLEREVQEAIDAAARNKP